MRSMWMCSPHPTTTWPWMRRSSTRSSTIGISRLLHAGAVDPTPTLLHQARHELREGHLAMEDEVDENGEIHAADDGRLGARPRELAGGEGAASAAEVGEDDEGVVARRALDG